MAHLFEDITDSFKYFRGLRNRRKLEPILRKRIESGDYAVATELTQLFEEQNKGDKK